MTLESTVEQRAREKVEASGGLLLKLTCLRGIPDRLLVVPGGRVAFLEYKRPGEDPRKLQKYWQRQLKALGFHAETVYTVERTLEIFEELKGAA